MPESVSPLVMAVVPWAFSVSMRSCPSLSCNQENFVGFTT